MTLDIKVEKLPAVGDMTDDRLRICREAAVAALSNALRKNFRAKNRTANAKGFPRSYFWQDAAESVTSSVAGNAIVATVRKEGVRLRWQGGVVRPKAGKKAIAIPKDPSVADMWPSEYSGALALIWPKASSHGWLKDEESGELLWLLVGQTAHKADPSVIPSDDALRTAIVTAAQAALEAS